VTLTDLRDDLHHAQSPITLYTKLNAECGQQVVDRRLAPLDCVQSTVDVRCFIAFLPMSCPNFLYKSRGSKEQTNRFSFIYYSIRSDLKSAQGGISPDYMVLPDSHTFNLQFTNAVSHHHLVLLPICKALAPPPSTSFYPRDAMLARYMAL